MSQRTFRWEIAIPQSSGFCLNVIAGARLILLDFRLATVDTEHKKSERILNLTTWCTDEMGVIIVAALLASGSQLSWTESLQLYALVFGASQFAVLLFDWKGCRANPSGGSYIFCLHIFYPSAFPYGLKFRLFLELQSL